MTVIAIDRLTCQLTAALWRRGVAVAEPPTLRDALRVEFYARDHYWTAAHESKHPRSGHGNRGQFGHKADMSGQTKFQWDEEKHPRAAKGTSEGGQFTSGEGSEQTTAATEEKSRYEVRRKDYAEQRGMGGSFHNAWRVYDNKTGAYGSTIYTSEAAARSSAARADWHTNSIRAQAFKKWFGDWETNPETASKVVNEDSEPQYTYQTPEDVSRVTDAEGTPLVVYHGSMHNHFNVFDPNKVGNYNLFGKGFYFTESLEVAKEYARKTNGVNDEVSYEHIISLRVPNDKRDQYFADYRALAASMEYNLPQYKQAKLGGIDAGKSAFLRTGLIAPLVESEYGGPEESGLGLAKRQDVASFYFTSVAALEEKYGYITFPDSSVKALYLNIRNPKNLDAIVSSEEVKDLMKWAAKEKRPEGQGTCQFYAKHIHDKIPEATAKKYRLPYDANFTESSVYKYAKAMREANPDLFAGVPDGQLSWQAAVWILTDGAASSTRVDAVNRYFRQHGHDGICHTGGWNIGQQPHKVWVAFEPTQIKAVANEGTFDSDNPDIRYSLSAAFQREFYRRGYPEQYRWRTGQAMQGHFQFREEQHPRQAKGKDTGGQFAPKGGGGGGGGGSGSSSPEQAVRTPAGQRQSRKRTPKPKESGDRFRVRIGEHRYDIRRDGDRWFYRPAGDVEGELAFGWEKVSPKAVDQIKQRVLERAKTKILQLLDQQASIGAKRLEKVVGLPKEDYLDAFFALSKEGKIYQNHKNGQIGLGSAPPARSKRPAKPPKPDYTAAFRVVERPKTKSTGEQYRELKQQEKQLTEKAQAAYDAKDETAFHELRAQRDALAIQSHLMEQTLSPFDLDEAAFGIDEANSREKTRQLQRTLAATKEAVKAEREGKVKRAASIAEEYEISFDDLLEAAKTVVLPERREWAKMRQTAKEAATKLTGMTATKAQKLEDSGKDYDSIRGFDTAALHIASEYPGVIGNYDFEQAADAPIGDLCGNLWELLTETKERLPDVYDEDILQSAAEWVKANTTAAAPSAAAEEEFAFPWEREGGDIPEEFFRPGATMRYALAGAFRKEYRRRETHGRNVERYRRMMEKYRRERYNQGWDESKHPRGQPKNKGEFVEKSNGGSSDKIQRLADDAFHNRISRTQAAKQAKAMEAKPSYLEALRKLEREAAEQREAAYRQPSPKEIAAEKQKQAARAERLRKENSELAKWITEEIDFDEDRSDDDILEEAATVRDEEENAREAAKEAEDRDEREYAEWCAQKEAVENAIEEAYIQFANAGWTIQQTGESITGSHYFTLTRPSKYHGDDYGGVDVTLRISTHYAPRGSGFNEQTQDYHAPPDVNLVAQPGTPIDWTKVLSEAMDAFDDNDNE